MKTTGITIRLSPEMKEKLSKICKQEGRSQTAQFEYWIRMFQLNDEK